MRNLQQIPSHEKTMRLAFKASTEYKDIEEINNKFIVKDYSDVLTKNGWKKSKEIVVGDILIACNDGEEGSIVVVSVVTSDNNIIIEYEGWYR